MDRLTDTTCGYMGYMGFTAEDIKARCIRLKEYEDLELTPSEIKEKLWQLDNLMR